MVHDRPGPRRPPARQDVSTGRALLLAGTLVVTLLAAAMGVLAALGAFNPAPGTRTATGEVRQPPVTERLATAAPAEDAPKAASVPAPDPPRQTAPASGAGRLTGFGATVLDWGANHRVDPRVGDASAYDPDPAVGGDGRPADRYVQVLPLDGRVLQYTYQMARHTPLATASRQTLAQLPADVHALWQRQQTNCYQVSYTSVKLGDTLGDVGDAKGAVVVEYRSGVAAGSPWDPEDVTNATVSALDAPTPATAPLC